MLTVNVWPALAVTPHTGSFLVSVLVWLAENIPQNETAVGNAVGTAVGTAEGAVGCVVGEAVGTPGIIVGPAVGSVLGTADGFAVVGLKVGIDVGRAVCLNVGAVVGVYVTNCKPAPAMMAVPEHVVAPVQPSRMMYV